MASTTPFQPFAPRLSTSRLDLEFHDSSDEHYESLIGYLNSPTALKTLGDHNVHTHAELDDFVAPQKLHRNLFRGHASESGRLQQCCVYHIRPKADNLGAGKLVGGVSLNQSDDKMLPDAGWLLSDEYSGQGYATEAAAELLRYAREDLGLDVIVTFSNPDNVRSIKVAERIGLVKGGEVENKNTGRMKLIYVRKGMKWNPEDGAEVGQTK